MREQLKIPEEQLQACLRNEYGLDPARLEFLPRGKDYSAGLYRVLTGAGADYLVKVTSRPLYEPTFLVPRYLMEQGITAVVAPIPAKSRALWTKLADWTVIVYPFIEGDTSLTGMTNEQWQQVGSIFQQIHHVQLAPGGLPSLKSETFNPTVYAEWIHTFETEHLDSAPGQSPAGQALRAAWRVHQPTIHAGVLSLEKLGEVLRASSHRYVICHADLHGANLIRDRNGHVFVIDWDEVMLAPKERDFIFIRDPHAKAFWTGYGQRDIDWTALTYFCWERVVQDLTYNAENVCLRDDLAEQTKAEIAGFFNQTFAERKGNLAAALSAAAHLAREAASRESGR